MIIDYGTHADVAIEILKELKYFSRKRTVSTEKKVVFYKSSFRRIIRSASNVKKK